MVETSVGQRFMQLIQQLGLSKNAFAMSLDKTATVIQHLVDERNKPGFDLMCKVFEVYPNVSRDWLLLGKGPMLLDSSAEAPEIAAPAKPLAVPVTTATPSFPAPLFTVSAARQPVSEASLPPLTEPNTSAPQAALEVPSPATAKPAPAPAATAQPAPLPAMQPLGVPEPAPVAPTPAQPDAAYLTAALHAQHLQHQLALAEQRNQHLLAQQALMQQMLDLMRRPAYTA